MSASIARPNIMAQRTASSFNTGSVPGIAKSTAQAWVLASAPKVVEALENIFVLVAICA